MPNTGAAEARSAADSVAAMGDVATKADVKAALAELETRLTWRLVGGIVILLAAMSTGFGLIGFLLSA